MSEDDRNYILFVEDLDGATEPSRVSCEDLDTAERTGRQLMLQGRRVSIEVREAEDLLYTLHL